MSPARTFAPIYQIGFSGGGKLAFLLVNVLLYKQLDLQEMGLFAVLYAVAIILAIVSECGLRGLLVRELAKNVDNPDTNNEIICTAITLRLATFAPYLAIGSGVGWFYAEGIRYSTLFLILLAAWCDSNALVLRGAFRAYGLLIVDVILAWLFKCILLILTAVAYWNNALTLQNFSIIFAVVAILEVAITVFFIHRKTPLRFNLLPRRSEVTLMLQRGTHFLLFTILGLLYIRVGMLTLGIYKTDSALAEAAALNMSSRIPEGVTFLPIALVNAAIPFFSRNSNSPNDFLPLLRRMEFVIGSAGIVIAVGLVFFSEQLIQLLSTPEYLQYKLVFQLYAVTTFFTFLQYIYANVIVSLNYEKQVTLRYAMVLALSVGLNLILVPIFGALGVVITLLVCEIVAVCTDLRFLHTKGIAVSVSSLGKWSLLTAIFIGFAGALQFLPSNLAFVLYWVVGGVAGLLILTKAKLGHH